MSGKKIFLLCNLILLNLCGCVENSQQKNVESKNESAFNESVEIKDSLSYSNNEFGCEIKILNCDLDVSSNADTMKINLTKEEERIVRDVERKYNRRLFENAEYAPDYFIESLEDFQKYTSVTLKVINDLLRFHGYKAPDETAFYKKVEEICIDDYHDFYKSSDFFTPRTNFDSINDRPSDLELSLQLSTKFRMAWFDAYSTTKIISFEKEIECKDTFGLEYVKYDENSDIVLDMKKLKLNIFANLYIFNDNKAAKVWLITHDLDFFNRIRRFEDREVNEIKLKNYLSSVPDEYETHDVSRDIHKTDKLWIGKDIFDLVFEKTDSAIVAYEANKRNQLDIKAFDLLYMYLDKYHTEAYMRTEHYFIEQICFFAKMEVELNKKHATEEKHGYFNFVCQSRASSLLDDELLEFAKKENYFNIESFDEVLKVIEWDKESHYDPNETYPGGCIPFDYTTLLK